MRRAQAKREAGAHIASRSLVSALFSISLQRLGMCDSSLQRRHETLPHASFMHRNSRSSSDSTMAANVQKGHCTSLSTWAMRSTSADWRSCSLSRSRCGKARSIWLHGNGAAQPSPIDMQRSSALALSYAATSACRFRQSAQKR